MFAFADVDLKEFLFSEHRPKQDDVGALLNCHILSTQITLTVSESISQSMLVAGEEKGKGISFLAFPLLSNIFRLLLAPMAAM